MHNFTVGAKIYRNDATISIKGKKNSRMQGSKMHKYLDKGENTEES